MFAAGTATPPTVSITVEASGAAVPGIAPGWIDGVVAPQPVPYASTIVPVTFAITRPPEVKNSGEADPTATPLTFPLTGLAPPQFVMTFTVTGPGGTSGTCTFIWV